jgi:transcription factor SPT20
MTGQPMNQSQQQMFQNQLMRAQAQQAQLAQGQGGPQIAQNYQAQLAAMAQRTGQMPQNMNFNGQGIPNMQQMQQIQQMQQMQQMQAAAQAQAQAQAHAQNQQQPQMNAQAQQQAQNAMLQKSIANLYQQNYPTLQAQFPNGIPDDALRNFKSQCQQTATQQVHQTFRARRQMAQHQQMLAAQQGGMNPNGMNGMGMQRPNGM